MPHAMTIAEAALATGLTAHTLRYYEQIGLIDPVPRRSGQRVYGETEIRLIGFVLKLRATGMPMRDIQEYVRLRRLGDTPESIRLRGDLLARHAAHLREELASLNDTIQRLDDKIALYRSMYVADGAPSPAEAAAPPPTPANAPSKRRKQA
ncbi:MerR family transcriptional regulator [Luteibacter aegosomatis]|uniref:MerR family transcriptional regulator n=1 Tax=Luteibacter aegosomatis TaxID=2911537 RepID=UPI001FF8BE38|nr:MerR family transcriptional regulator [Luteibacter aegosomatis]UPG85463.1 MerR family transcriptional regulator [Luteibacter aegosomatis]